MKIVFSYSQGKSRSVWDWPRIPYHEYVKLRATTVLEFGTDGLEKVVVEGDRGQ